MLKNIYQNWVDLKNLQNGEYNTEKKVIKDE